MVNDLIPPQDSILSVKRRYWNESETLGFFFLLRSCAKTNVMQWYLKTSFLKYPTVCHFIIQDIYLLSWPFNNLKKQISSINYLTYTLTINCSCCIQTERSVLMREAIFRCFVLFVLTDHITWNNLSIPTSLKHFIVGWIKNLWKK